MLPYPPLVRSEHPRGRGMRRAAVHVERGDRLARGRQALLVGVGVGVGDAVGDRTLQVPGRAEPERTGVADVELDQGPALCLELAGPAGQFAADRSEEHTSELQSLMRISYAVFCLTK